MTDPDELDDDDTGTIVVALMQKERRKKLVEGQQMLTIGYYIYKVSCLMVKMSENHNLIFEAEYIIHSSKQPLNRFHMTTMEYWILISSSTT